MCQNGAAESTKLNFMKVIATTTLNKNISHGAGLQYSDTTY